MQLMEREAEAHHEGGISEPRGRGGRSASRRGGRVVLVASLAMLMFAAGAIGLFRTLRSDPPAVSSRVAPALDDKPVIASGTSPVAVFHAAEDSGRHPYVTCVGREDEPTHMRRVGFPSMDKNIPVDCKRTSSAGNASWAETS